MTSDERPSFGQRLYRALFRVFGPADISPVGPPPATNPNDHTVPAGYHLETVTDGRIRNRIAVQDEPDENQPAHHQTDQNTPRPDQADQNQP